MDEYLKHQLREDDLNKLMEKMKNDLLTAMKKDGPKLALEVFKRQSQVLAAVILEAEIQIANLDMKDAT